MNYISLLCNGLKTSWGPFRTLLYGRSKFDQEKKKKKKKKAERTYSTGYSQAVTHPSTNPAQRCLTSVIRRELVYSTWYGRRPIKCGTSTALKITMGGYFLISMYRKWNFLSEIPRIYVTVLCSTHGNINEYWL